MKKKTLFLILAVAILLIAAVAVGLYFLLDQPEEMTAAEESGEVFYRNDLLTVGADPDVLYITEGEDAGYYYMYITSDDIHGAGFLAYKSRDLVEWVCTGVALDSGGSYDEATGYTTISFAFSNYWAPEVVYDPETKLYYMFYTANRYDTGFASGLYFFGDIAVSESPAGPFVQYNKYLGKEPVTVDAEKKIRTYEPVFDFANMDPGHPLYETDTDGYMKVIDLHPFVDPVSGRKYLYFCHDLGAAQAISESSIYVMALRDDYTPDYSQVYALTSPNCLERDGEYDTTMNEGSVNEAPYMLYNEQSGKYYLLYSANSYLQKTYCVRVAVGDSPTGPFRKLTREEGGYLLYADSHWTWASGTGHCSVVRRDGQDYIMYHAHLDRVNGNSKRSVAVDELHWTENGNGLLIPVANGPSASRMPLTTYLYENVAPEAKITADHLSQGTAKAMIDGIITQRESSFLQDAVFDGSSATVTLTFDEPKTVCGIAVYNSYDYDYMYSDIESICLKFADGESKQFQNLPFDWDSYYTEEGYVIPGGSVSLEFEPAKVTEIAITMPGADEKYAISEIAVMAKRQDRAELPEIEDNGWHMDAPGDDTVTFDGIVNPEEYTGQKISFSDTNGVTLTMYSKMAEEGVFFGFHSNDTSVYVNPEQPIYQNTSVEIQLGKGGTEDLNANVVQLRYGLDGSTEGWIGVQSAETYEYMRTYINTVSKVHIYGQLNSSDCQGYDVECFIPYHSLNLLEKPDSLICAPSFNTRKDYDATGRTTWTLMVGSSFQDPTSWYRIDKDGQTVMTDGFRVNGDQIAQTGGSNQFYNFTDTLSDAYYVNADITIGEVLNEDGYPKFGLYSKSLDSMLGYYFDYAGERVNTIGRIGAKTTEFAGTQWQWETNASHTFGIEPVVSLNQEKTVNVELIRYEDQLALLVNGRFVMSDVNVRGLENGSIPGLFFFNTTADITVNHYVTEKETVRHYIAPYLPEIEPDGDLREWDRNRTLLASEEDPTNGNAMSVYAYRDERGIYLAYEVKHGYQSRVYMWNDAPDERGAWYFNTNAEFWINETHFAATAFGDSGYMVRTLKTTEDLVAGTYTTVAEVFVPAEVIGEGKANMGFAFKTCDLDYKEISEVTDPAMKFRGDPWWFFEGRFPTDTAKRFTPAQVPAGEETAPSQTDETYTVTVLPTANGTVSANVTQAKAGEKITLNATPAEGYAVITQTVNGRHREDTFTMPAEDVVVVARFGYVEAAAAPTYPNGNFFGSAGFHHSSQSLNMATDWGKNPYLVMDSGKETPLYAYVKGMYAQRFCLELTAQVTNIRSGEKFPKFGLMTNDGREMVKFYLDMTTDKQAGAVGAVHQPFGLEDDWAGQSTWKLTKPLDLTSGKVKLTLLRDGESYYFYVNGALVATGKDLSDKYTTTGIFSFGTSLKVTDYRLVRDTEAIDSLLQEAQLDAQAFASPVLTENFFTQTADGVYTLTTDSDAQHLVDDVLVSGNVLRQANYSLKGKLTLTDAQAWGQARILISADPGNEYVIALEMLENCNYQIFTMSKAGEEDWSNWTLIEDAQRNGNRNSMDFEVIVIGNRLYLLVDGEVFYTDDRVPMTESTVKFTGYNAGTTTVSDLSLTVFSDEAQAQAYAEAKPNRYGENFGASQGIYWTTDGVDLRQDKGAAPTVSFVGGAPQYAYWNDVFTDRFSFETQVNVSAVLNGDGYPKFGVMTKDSTEMVKFFVDMTPQMKATHVGVVYQPTGGADDWAGSRSCPVSGMSFTGSDTVKLKLVRDGSAYYFFVNDSLVLYDEAGFTQEKSAVGIFSFNTALTASRYSILTGTAADSAIQNARDALAALTKLGLTCNWFADQGSGVYTLTTNSGAEHKVDDLTQGGNVLRTAYYSVKGKLTLTGANDWGQARILVSSDARNEYFIALEKLPSGKYQIFTMSKANQTGWDKWELILHENTNGTRNSLDFELIVMGNRLYFLIDGAVVYTASRVAMAQSTVKFTGFNVGTTTVENLSATVFENQQQAEAYLSEKN